MGIDACRDLDMKRNIVDPLILISDVELKQFISSQTQTCFMHNYRHLMVYCWMAQLLQRLSLS